MEKGLSEAFDLASSRGYDSDLDSLSLRNLSTRHPTLPPSALGGCTSRFPARIDAPVEVITNQMAGVLRAVETKVRRIEVSSTHAFYACTPLRLHKSETQSISCSPFVPIVCQALDFDWSREEENNEPQNPKGGRVEQTKSPACALEDEDEIEDDKEGDNMMEVNADGNLTPLVSAPERSELAAELHGNLASESGKEFETSIAYDTLAGRLLFPSELPVFSNAVHQSWLNGQTTLQQAGQCIGADLEVAMLCMQKRLGKVKAIIHVNRTDRRYLLDCFRNVDFACFSRQWPACLRLRRGSGTR